MTDAERILWPHLKNKKLGYRFRRQHGLGPYIVDFYCPEKRLIIELDGTQHVFNKAYDEKRDAFLSSLNMRILRVWNNEVFQNLEGVIVTIESLLQESTPQSFSAKATKDSSPI